MIKKCQKRYQCNAGYQHLKRENAQNYITSLFVALSENAQKNSGKDLSILVKNSQTSGGLNEQGVKLFKKFKFYWH